MLIMTWGLKISCIVGGAVLPVLLLFTTPVAPDLGRRGAEASASTKEVRYWRSRLDRRFLLSVREIFSPKTRPQSLS